MTGNSVNGSRNGARSGAHTLTLLATPLNVSILQTLAEGPQQQSELRRACGSPAQTTLRAQLKRLMDVGAIERRRRNRFPGVLEYELTPPGRELLFVLEVLQKWLERAPGGPLEPGSNSARAAVKALAEAWSTTILRAIAAGPRTLTELDSVITSLSYPSLERRLAAMRLASQIEARTADGRGTPYAATEWLRHGIAPLAAAVRWERRHRGEATSPLGGLDVETALLLVVPLLRLPDEACGACRLAVEIPNGTSTRLVGVVVGINPGGRISSCTTSIRTHADAWALGSTAAWLDAVIDRDTKPLEIGGDHSLASALLDGLHKALFGRTSSSHLT